MWFSIANSVEKTFQEVPLFAFIYNWYLSQVSHMGYVEKSMSSFRFLHTYDVENSKIIPHLEKFQFFPEHRCFFLLQFTLFCRRICFCFWIIAYFDLFFGEPLWSVSPLASGDISGREDSLSPLWKHFSNRWQDPIWPTFSLGSNRCKSSYDASFCFEPYLSLINLILNQLLV